MPRECREGPCVVIMCPVNECVYNGYGECQLGAIAGALEAGVATDRFCPYYQPGGREGEPEEPADPPNPRCVSGEQILG